MIFGVWFINTLLWWQWVILGVVPAAIIALYFLKLRRQPLEVPSTYLWHRTIEDLHVNSLWQRLRQSILLFLQLLLVALLMFAVLRPGWRGAMLEGDRFIFLIDTSASMSATDVEPTRLEQAKKQVRTIIDQMKSGDAGMIVSFSDRAHIEQQFTDNRRALRRAIDDVGPTNRTSDLTEALQVAAGLANPGRTSEAGGGDVQVAEAQEATLYIYTDGGFGRVTNFSMGNLEPIYESIGSPQCRNVGIVAFSTQRNPEHPEKLQAYARLENYTRQPVTVTVSLYLNNSAKDAGKVELPKEGSGGIEFELGDLESGVLKLQIDEEDDFAIDNTAFAAINVPRRARVLLVTPENEALLLAMTTDRASKIAQVATAQPAILTTEAHQQQAASGAYDLIIYDQSAPPEKMPQANTLLIGRMPPLKSWKTETTQPVPQIIDTDRTHPLMRYIDLGNITIAEGTSLKPPPGSTALIEADIGTIGAVAPREGFEDAVLGFEIVGCDKTGQRYANTDWVRRYSFPLFVQNALAYLGSGHIAISAGSVQPGKPIRLRTAAPVDRITVVSPSGEKEELRRQGQSGFSYGNTNRLGIYDVHEKKDLSQQFAVNLFDSAESDIRPKPEIYSGYEEIKARSAWQPMRKEAWRYVLLAAIAILSLEWYIFNRRVYL